MNFEADLRRIEEILAKMEQGSVSLDESMKLFEEAVKLTKGCREYLDKYKGKFEIIKEQLEEDDD